MTTRWSDQKTTILDDAIELMLQPIPDDTFIMNWNTTKSFAENLTMNLGNRCIQYNLINLSYDQINSHDTLLVEDMTKHNEIFVIPYHNGTKVSYIIGKNSGAQTTLRKLLRYEGKGEIVKSTFDRIDSDFFVWIINKVYSDDYVIETGNDVFGDVILKVIKEFKGDTEDQLTTVTARGESVINIISTLSFLLESNKLNQIRLDISTIEHSNIELHLTDKGTISTNYLKYMGVYGDIAKDLWKAKMYLMIYLEIVPALLQSYQNDDWNKERNIEFMKKVAADLTLKIDKKIETFK